MIAKFRTLAISGLVAASSLCAQQTGYLKTKVDPGRAGVFIDGKYVGPAGNFGVGRKYSLPLGEHKIKLVEPRYEDIETSVKVESGKTVEVKQSMKALPVPKGPFGVLHTWSADKFAAVYVNDHFVGHAGEFNNPWQGLKLPVGEYAVRIEPPTGQSVNQKIKIEAEKSVMVK
jgi:hypothetical protein